MQSSSCFCQCEIGRCNTVFLGVFAHTHTRCYTRCFKDIATAGTGSVDAEVVQLIYPSCAKEFIGAKSGLDLQRSCKHLSTGDGNSFSFAIWKIQRKSEEHLEKIWGKCVEHFSFDILVCSGFNQRSHWSVISLTCPSYASQICPASFDQSFGHRYVYDISVHSLSQAFQQLWFRAFMSRFWQASFFLECQPVSP